MGFHVYCIVPAGHAVPDECTGLAGVRPEPIEAAGLGLWVSRHLDPIPPSLDNVRLHHAVVNAAMTPQVTPVPARYGQWFADRETAAARLAEAAGAWRDLLARFAGHAEHGVLVTAESGGAEQDVHSAQVASGKEYMAALARKQARATSRRREGERVAAEFAARIGALASETRAEYGTRGLVVLAHLVAWSDAAAYHRAVETARAHAGVRTVLTGPWPPYTFVE